MQVQTDGVVEVKQEYRKLDAGEAETERIWINDKDEERVQKVLIERRYTIGGGSLNPNIRRRRQTNVAESREEGSKPSATG